METRETKETRKTSETSEKRKRGKNAVRCRQNFFRETDGTIAFDLNDCKNRK